MVVVHLGCLRVHLVRVLERVHGRQPAVRLEAVVRRHRRVQTAPFEVRFHRQHVFRRREQFAGFLSHCTHANT